MKRHGQPDPVTPELHAYVLRRDGGCMVAAMAGSHRMTLPDPGPCGGPLTAAHVRDRGKGGRTGKRPPSVPRHLVAACRVHHIDHPWVDRADYRDALDALLEAVEGPSLADDRPWEAIPRVRSGRP